MQVSTDEPPPSNTIFYGNCPQYVHENFTKPEHTAENNALIQVWDNMLEGIPGGKVLDAGTNIILTNGIPYAGKPFDVYVSDYNHLAIASWQRFKNEGYSPEELAIWTPYISNYLLSKYIEPNEQNIAFYFNILQNQIVEAISCDIFQSNPIGLDMKFKVVQSHYVSESITPNKVDVISAISNLTSLIEDDGYLILSLLGESNFYIAEGKKIDTCFLTTQDVEQIIQDLGLELERLETVDASDPYDENNPESDGYKYTIIVRARKPARLEA